MAVSTKVGSFVKTAATGSQTVTGVGFQPKALILWTSNQDTANFTEEHFRTAIGFCDTSLSQRCICAASDDAVATSSSASGDSNTVAIKTVSGAGTTTFFTGTITSFNSDGFVINWSTAVTCIIFYYAIGGTDISNVKVGTFASHLVTGNDDVTGVGFKPDFLMLLNRDSNANVNTNLASAALNVGLASSTSKQCANSTVVRDGQAIMDTYRYQRNDKVFVRVSGATGALYSEATLVSFDTDGFTINWSTAPVAALGMFYLAIKGGNHDVGTFNIPIATGVQTVTTTNNPKGLFLLSVDNPTSTSIQAHCRFSLGAASSTTDEVAIWHGDKDVALDAANARANFNNRVFYSAIENATAGSSPVSANGSLDSFGTNQFAINWANVTNPTVGEVIFWTVGNQVTTYPVTINETAITLADTLKKKVAVKSMAVQTVVIGASALAVKTKRILHEPVAPNPNALSFVKASSQYVNCTASATFELLTEMSYVCWFKYSANPASSAVMMSKGGVVPYIASTAVVGCDVVYNGASNWFAGVANAVQNTKDVWHLVVFTHSNSGGRTRVYFDGVLKATNTVIGSGLAARVGYPFLIGAQPTGVATLTNYFGGLVDEVTIHNVELTQDEITSLYAGGRVFRGRVAHFGLNEGSGTSTTDEVGSVVGTFVNSPTWTTDTPLAKSYGLTDTVARKVKRPIIETAISLAATLTRKLKAKRTLSETAISLTDTVVREVKRPIVETAISIADTLTTRLSSRRILHEPVPPNTYSLSFDQPSAQYINCGTSPTLELLDEVTIIGWGKISVNPPTTFEAIFSNYNLMAYFNLSGHLLATARYTAGVPPNNITTLSLTPAKNVWHHVAITHSKSNNRTRMYYNGVLIQEHTLPANTSLVTVPTFPFCIGATPTSASAVTYNFHGLVDDIRVHNVELTLEEIQYIYNNGGIIDRGVVAHFPLNEGTGTSTTDTVGGIVASLINTPIWSTDTPLVKTYGLTETLSRQLSARRTISETAISLAATLTRRLSARRVISESAVSLAATLSRRLLGRRTISESAISLGATLTRRFFARRTISEGVISSLDSITIKRRIRLTITETAIALGGTVSKRLSAKRAITEPGQSIADNITSRIRRVKTITESAISLAELLRLKTKRILEDLVTVDPDTVIVTPPAETVISSILTTSRGNFGATGATTAGATQYWYCGNGMLFPSATEANRQIPWHTPGVFSKLYIRVIASTTSANSTVVLRKNGVDQTLGVTIGAGAIGPFENTVNEIAIADGDNVCLKSVSGGTGTLTFSIMSVLFKADDGSTVTKEVAMGRAATTSGTTQYSQITGDRSGTSAVEANMESRMKAPGIYKSASIFVSANAKTTDTVVTFRKNRIDTAITWIIAAGFVGRKEDTTNPVIVAAEDEVDWKIIYATDTANITIENFAIDFESTNRIHFPVAGASGATADITQDFGTTNYYVIGGAIREVTVESEQKLKTRLPFTYFGLNLHAQVNTVNGPTTIKFRKNGADGNELITIPAATAGWQSDDINLDSVQDIDEIDIEVTTAGTSGTITIRNMSLVSQGLLVGVSYFRTITEPVEAVSDTITSVFLTIRRILTETGISISDLITRKLRSRRLTTETVLTADTISTKKTLRKLISELAVSASDSLIARGRVRRTITESTQSIADSIVRKVTTRLTISELAVSFSDTLTRKYYSLRTVLEGAIPTTDLVRVRARRVISNIVIISDFITRRLRLTITELGITITDNIPTERLQSRRIIDNTISVSDIMSKRLFAKRKIDEIGQTISDYVLVTFAYFATITEPAIQIADNIPIIRVFIGVAKKGRRFFRHLGFGSTSLRRG